jgi:hypothetical protein
MSTPSYLVASEFVNPSLYALAALLALKELQYPSNMRLCCSQSWSGRLGEECVATASRPFRKQPPYCLSCDSKATTRNRINPMRSRFVRYWPVAMEPHKLRQNVGVCIVRNRLFVLHGTYPRFGGSYCFCRRGLIQIYFASIHARGLCIQRNRNTHIGVINFPVHWDKHFAMIHSFLSTRSLFPFI